MKWRAVIIIIMLVGFFAVASNRVNAQEGPDQTPEKPANRFAKFVETQTPSVAEQLLSGTRWRGLGPGENPFLPDLKPGATRVAAVFHCQAGARWALDGKVVIRAWTGPEQDLGDGRLIVLGEENTADYYSRGLDRHWAWGEGKRHQRKQPEKEIGWFASLWEEDSPDPEDWEIVNTGRPVWELVIDLEGRGYYYDRVDSMQHDLDRYQADKKGRRLKADHEYVCKKVFEN